MSNPAIESDQSEAQPDQEDQVTKKFIVAVHGIGDQIMFGAIKSAAFRFFSYRGAPANIPLGKFHIAQLTDDLAPLLLVDSPRTELRFAEAYWASVPRDMVKQGYTLEESKRWAQTVVERFHARYDRKQKEYDRKPIKDKVPASSQTQLTRDDFSKVKQILLEVIESLRILERLVMLGEKAGLFKFNLRKLLDDYAGDVQIVADFQTARLEILARFQRVMKAVADAYPNAEIYIVAHSEGTVVSFLGLLTAMTTGGPDAAWAKRVRGFMTIGSPLDKHLLLWPELFSPFEVDKRDPAKMEEFPVPADQRIQWKNYYDYGDPIGFNLRKIRGWLKRNEWTDSFQFADDDDYEFSRYFLPGKAHTDYWQDKEVFGHFIENVVKLSAYPLPGKTAPYFSEPPKTKRWASLANYGFPYLLFALLSFAAIFVLRKGVLECISPQGDPASGQRVLMSVGLSALALSGLTAMSGIFRLTRTGRWRLYGAILFVLLAIPYWVFHWPGSQARLFVDRLIAGNEAEVRLDSNLPIIWVLTIASAALASGALLVLLSNWAIKKWPSWGLKPLLVLIGAPVGAVIAGIVYTSPYRDSLWPLLLSGAGAVYLWWLAALLFDLIFIWHYYIRHEAAINSLREPTLSNTKKPVNPRAPQPNSAR